MKNFGNYAYFYFLGGNPSYSFRSYNDPNTGMEVGYVTGYDKNKQPIYKSWYFDNGSKRQIRVSKEEIDLTGRSAIEFLRNSPECYKSTNGAYDYNGKQLGAYFKEIDEDKDAVDAVSTRAIVVDAQAKALKLKGQKLTDVASYIGVFSDKDAIKVHRVLDYASNFPDKFLALVDDPSLEIKSLVKKALNDGIFKQDGKMIKWEGKTIGADEDDAVSALLKDAKLLDAVKVHLQKFGS